MNLLLELLIIIGFIPMIILQFYMSIILFPIAICGFIIWKYRNINKKVVRMNIVSHSCGLLSYIITKILTSRRIDLHYSVENTLTIIEIILVILFAIFGIITIVEIIKFNKKQENAKGTPEKKKKLTIGKLEDLKSPFVITKVAIFLIIIGFVLGLTYMENFMGNSYELSDSPDDEPYTLSFNGLSLSWRDSTGNDKYCEDTIYLYNPLNRKIDLYCFKVYETSIKIIEAKPGSLIIKDPMDEKNTYYIER